RAAYRGLMPHHILDQLDVSKRALFWRKVLNVPDSNVFVFVADDSGRILGFSSSGPSRDADLDARSVADLMALYLDPVFQRRGYGRLLCEQAMAEAARRGFLSMALWVLEANIAARGFYEALGFSTDGAERIGSSSELSEVRYGRNLEGV